MNELARKRRVAALGECMVELREDPDGEISSGFAGDTLNTATYLRRLLPRSGFDVEYVTAVGDDHLSAEMLARWQAEGIGTRLVRKRPGELPGLYWIRTDSSGEREFFYWRSASAARNVLVDGHDQEIIASLTDGDFLYLSGISFAILADAHREALLRLLADCRANGVRIVFDSNFRRRLWASTAAARQLQRRLLPLVRIFITSHADEAALFGDRDIAASADRLTAASVPEWVVRGEPGETIASSAGRMSATFVEVDRVVDTTGAGDSFAAAYLAARLSGHDVGDAIRAGHALAAVVVCHRGAIIGRETTPGLTTLVNARP